MNVLTIIPARGGSKRLPNKNILLLGDKPVISYTIEAALASELTNKVVVSTDSTEITTIVKTKHKIDIIKRPKELATDFSPIEDCLKHAVNYYEERKTFYNIVVWLQADCPIRKEGRIDEVISKLIENDDLDSVVTVEKTKTRPEWLQIAENGQLHSYLPICKEYRTQDLPDLYSIDGSVLAIRKATLMRDWGDKNFVHSYLGNKIGFIEQNSIFSISIDNEFDFDLARMILNDSICDRRRFQKG